MQNNNITIRQARLQGREGLWQLTVENGRFSRIEAQDAATLPQGEVLDAEGGLAIPPFVEPHIHLDTTQTAGEPSWNQSGTIFEGNERWAERKAKHTTDHGKAPNGEALLEEAVRLGADVIGAIPHFEFTRNMAWSRCTKFSPSRKNTTDLSTCTVTKLTMSNHALLKPSRRWPIATIWASA